MKMRYSLVLFDLDGTLLDTLDDLTEAVNYALGLRGLPLHNREGVRARIGHGVRNLVKQALPEALRRDDALVDACLADFRSYYTEHINVHTVPYPGIPGLLAELDTAGVKLAVVSNKFQEGTDYLIRKFFPDVRFCAILGNRPGFPLKPDPAIVQEALSLSGVPVDRAVLVGDSATDMQTAANGGVAGIGVSWGYRPVESLSAATRIVHSVSELREAIFGKFDCHCHILPGLDDGAADLEESLDLCRWLVGRGYEEAVCTSHCNRLYPNTEAIVEDAAGALQRRLDWEGIPLRLIPSLEYRLVPAVWPRPLTQLLPWKGNHILIELPLKTPEKMGPIVPEDEIARLVEAGFQPVLAHPERYLWASPADYERWLAAGVVFQRNLGALEGFYGDPARLRARYLEEKGCYSFVGTDLHNRRYAEFFNGIISL